MDGEDEAEDACSDAREPDREWFVYDAEDEALLELIGCGLGGAGDDPDAVGVRFRPFETRSVGVCNATRLEDMGGGGSSYDGNFLPTSTSL